LSLRQKPVLLQTVSIQISKRQLHFTIKRVSTPQNKLIVVLDEFQSILEIDKNMDKQLRSIMQEQTGINYIFLGRLLQTLLPNFGTGILCKREP
jgi:hypothetical protein